MTASFDPDSFGFLVTDIARLLRNETDRRIIDAGLDLTHGEGRTLAHIARLGEGRQSVLAEAMGIEAMTLSGLLDRLEVRGLIERLCDPLDRRAKLVSLTPAGEAMLANVRQVAVKLRTTLAADFDAKDWDRFDAMLKAVRDRLQDLRCEPKRGAA